MGKSKRIKNDECGVCYLMPHLSIVQLPQFVNSGLFDLIETQTKAVIARGTRAQMENNLLLFNAKSPIHNSQDQIIVNQLGINIGNLKKIIAQPCQGSRGANQFTQACLKRRREKQAKLLVLEKQRADLIRKIKQSKEIDRIEVNL